MQTLINTSNTVEFATLDPLAAILPITERGGIEGVDARNLQSAIGLTKDFSTWIKAQLERADGILNEDFILLPFLGEQKRGGNNRKDYHLSSNFAKELCLIAGGEKGKSTRRYFINAEKAGRELHQAILDCNPAVLRKMAAVSEEKKRLEVQNAGLIDLNQGLNKTIEEITPLANYGRDIKNTDTVYTPSNMAVFTGFRSAMAFNKALRNLKIIKLGSGDADYELCSRYYAFQLTRYNQTAYQNTAGERRVKLALRYTQKGKDWLMANVEALHDGNKKSLPLPKQELQAAK